MKILIVDDHAIVRAGIVAVLRQCEPDTSVLEAGDGSQAFAIAHEHPDLDAVLLDLKLPNVDGRSVLEGFARRHPALPVLILSSSEDPSDIRASLAHGALGYVPKSASSKTLISALHLVLQGEIYVPPQALGANGSLTAAPAHLSTTDKLTDRQLEVLKLIERGFSNKMIARELGLSDKTVKVHVTSILKTLNVTSRTQAAIHVRAKPDPAS